MLIALIIINLTRLCEPTTLNCFFSLARKKQTYRPTDESWMKFQTKTQQHYGSVDVSMFHVVMFSDLYAAKAWWKILWWWLRHRFILFCAFVWLTWIDFYIKRCFWKENNLIFESLKTLHLKTCAIGQYYNQYHVLSCFYNKNIFVVRQQCRRRYNKTLKHSCKPCQCNALHPKCNSAVTIIYDFNSFSFFRHETKK